MGKAMTFVVLVWLSVVLVFSAWLIAQSGRYSYVVSEGTFERLLDTHTGTTYRIHSLSPYAVYRCGPSAYLCEKGMLAP